jgi:RNA polymerase sigma-70 factor (ECF subfamily)
VTEARAPESQDADWEALERVAAGDGEAFEALVEKHQARLLAVCERLLGEREEARDAAQEVFLKVFRHAAGVERRGQLFTWIYRIAVNHCLNRMRRRRIARFLPFGPAGGGEEGAPGLPEPVQPGPDPEVELVTRERWRATRAAIDRLPPGQRAVLILAKFEGLSYREIAATLGVTEGAVESRLVRAMRRLAAQEGAPPRVPREEKAP